MHCSGRVQLRKLPRRHLERGVDARRVVYVDGAVDLGDELAECREAVRIAELHLELVVEGLLVAVLPRAAFLGAGDLDVAIREYLPERDRIVLNAVVGVEDVRSRVMVERSAERLDHDDRAVRRCHRDANDVSRVHVHDGRKIHGAAFPRDIRELG